MTITENPNRRRESLRAWLRLLSCEAQIERKLRSDFRKEFQVTLPQFDVLSEIEHAGRPLTMSELSGELMVSNGNITGVVDRLVVMGFVKRERSQKDRRIQYIRLTRKGSAAFKKMADKHAQWITQMFADVTQRDLKSAQALLLKLRQSVIRHG